MIGTALFVPFQAVVPASSERVFTTRTRIELKCNVTVDDKKREWLNVVVTNRGKTSRLIAPPVYGTALFAQAIGSKDRTWYPLVEGARGPDFVLLEPGQSFNAQSPMYFFFRHDKGRGIALRYDDSSANVYAGSDGLPLSKCGVADLGRMKLDHLGLAAWIEKVKKTRTPSWIYPDIFGGETDSTILGRASETRVAHGISQRDLK